MKKYLIIALLLCGCEDPTSEVVVIKNKETLGGPGFEVGTLPGGKKVVRYKIDMGSNEKDHYLYVVEGNDTKTLNREVQNGKHTDLRTEAFSQELHPDDLGHPSRRQE